MPDYSLTIPATQMFIYPLLPFMSYNETMLKKTGLTFLQNEQLPQLLLLSLLVLLVVKLLYPIFPGHKKEKKQPVSALPFCKASRIIHYTRKDWLVIIAASLLYGIISLTELGSPVFPVTTWQPQSDQPQQSFILQLDEETTFQQINAIYGEGDNNANPDTYQLGTDGMRIDGSNDLSSWNEITILEKGSIYEYQIIEGEWNYKYIRITAANKNQTLTEIAFFNDSETPLAVSVYEDDNNASSYPSALVIDEQDKVVRYPTYYDEAYFDEVYHPRNAWEIANGQHMYATVHPLLGTNIIALFIHLFGMSPLVWRLPGALFGIMIIPMLYAILKWMFVDTKLCTLGTILVSADFMHLTTSRIGTLEPFSVFFILLMFYWMIRYYYTSFYDTSFKKTVFLLLAGGISMGLAISTKWTACYSAVGLAIILFVTWFNRYREYRKAKVFLQQGHYTIQQQNTAEHIIATFPKYFTISFSLCFLFYLLIPAIIYWLSYLPDHVWRNDTWSIANVWEQNLYMYNYHTNLKATHPYSSTWYMWLVDARPIWYYSGVKETGVSHTIACFSNPLLTWAGIPAILYTAYAMFKKKSGNAFIIVTGYLTALGPWILLVSRCVFAYHFYPTSMFVILAIVYCAKEIKEKDSRLFKKCFLIFSTVYILLFILFLPVTAGFGTSVSYIHFLEWFPSWYFG